MHTIDMDSSQWTEMLMAGAAQFDIDLSREQVDQCYQHARLLLTWNRKINLTAIIDPLQVAAKHFIDSMAPLNHISPNGEILDVGTGGGFPGIPLKILRPGQPMTLIDGTRKKINFVKQVIRELGLAHIKAHHLRAEAIGDSAGHMGRYTTIVSRAVGDLSQVALLALPLLTAKGRIVAYKGPGETVPERLELAPKGEACTHAFQVTTVNYELPFVGDSRRAVIIEAATL